mmetsp:Transcript_26887/g.56991  ORF Transcript_26887/g.56991 Transcript_26887/m.56991 type:complete len:149 (+) Transcript_26887:621-1067(+)
MWKCSHPSLNFPDESQIRMWAWPCFRMCCGGAPEPCYHIPPPASWIAPEVTMSHPSRSNIIILSDLRPGSRGPPELDPTATLARRCAAFGGQFKAPPRPAKELEVIFQSPPTPLTFIEEDFFPERCLKAGGAHSDPGAATNVGLNSLA